MFQVSQSHRFTNVTPTEREVNAFFDKINKTAKKPVILSLKPPYANQSILKSRNTAAIPDLYNIDYLKLSYPELLVKC